MIKEAFLGIVSVAGVAGAVFAGMQIEQRLGSRELAEAEERGFVRGLAQAETNFKAVEAGMSSLAQEMSQLFNSPEAKQQLPSSFLAELNTALKQADEGNFELATRSLPSSADLLPIEQCIPVNVPFSMKPGVLVDLCESDTELAFSGFAASEGIPEVRVLVANDERWLENGAATTIPDTACTLTYRGVDEAGDERAAKFRYRCE